MEMLMDRLEAIVLPVVEASSPSLPVRTRLTVSNPEAARILKESGRACKVVGLITMPAQFLGRR
jgi:hypothetical protein